MADYEDGFYWVMVPRDKGFTVARKLTGHNDEWSVVDRLSIYRTHDFHTIGPRLDPPEDMSKQ